MDRIPPGVKSLQFTRPVVFGSGMINIEGTMGTMHYGKHESCELAN